MTVTTIAVLLILLAVNKIDRCNYGDGVCIQRVAQHVLSTYSEGIPELEVGPLDPIDIKHVKIENPGFVNIDLTLTDVKMSGLSKSTVKSVKGFDLTFNEEVFNELEISIPQVTIFGPYSIDGRVFFIPISGSGITNMTLDDLNLNFKFRGKRLTRDSQDFFRAEDMDLDLTTSKLHLQFDNLFNGDKFLGEQTNSFLNRRSEDIFREIKPKIRKVFADEISGRINEAFSRFPYKEYFLPVADLARINAEAKPEVKTVDAEVKEELPAEDAMPDAKPETKADAVTDEGKKEPKHE